MLTKNYSYLTTTSGQTSLVSSLSYSGCSSYNYTYTYDALGNITSVSRNGVLEASYEYDDLGQLKKEINNIAGKTWEYTYDDRGNLLSKKETVGSSTTTKSYTYFAQFAAEAWNDCIKTYNGSGAFTYDVIGNPLNYNNGSAYTFTWQNGRELATATVNGITSSYTYNSDGLRTRKVVGNKVYDYYWFGSQLAMMTITEGSNVITMKFYYDANGLPIIFDYNGTQYHYITNLQGDVVGLANEYGIVATYAYDAWGKIISTSGITSMEEGALAANPLRYRGYIYDTETGFYYLQSRYYDPVMCRFINIDGQLSLSNSIHVNLYMYCCNNPVMYYDPSGNAAETVIDIVSLVFSTAEVIANPYDLFNWLGFIGDVADVAIPGVAGIGEVLKALGTGKKVVKAAETVVENQELIKRTAKAIQLASMGGSASEGVYSLYVSYYENGTIEYVGITNCFERREQEWSKTRKIHELIPNLSKERARCAEQTMISLFGKNGKGILSNIRNSIGPNGKLRDDYIEFIKKLFKAV